LRVWAKPASHPADGQFPRGVGRTGWIAIGTSADLERLILRRPAWRRCRPTCRAAASRPQMAEASGLPRARIARFCPVLRSSWPDNIKKFIVRSQGYIGSLLSRRLPRPTSRITAPKRYDKVAIRDSSVSELFQRDFIRISTIPPRLETSLRCILFVSRGASMLITMQRGALQRPRDFGALFS
jgi:hypothetical protein